jgi:hypothetical protein
MIACSECGELEGGRRRAIDEVVRHELVMERAAATILSLYEVLHARHAPRGAEENPVPSWLEREAMQIHAELVRPQADFENIYHSLVTRGEAR